MNVWQTLEFLSGITLRKRYNYEGYNDNNNSILALAPSWRRDSFVEKNVDPTIDEATRRKSACLGSSSPGSGKYAGTSGNDNETMHKNSHGFGGSGGGFVNGPSAGRKRTKQKDRKSTQRHQTGNSRKRSHKSQSHRRKLPKPTVLIKELDMEFALSPTDYADLIKCTFNLPRISAALERLMGTNVVRLTDRNYMKELRERIEDDYRQNLQKRIKARELKEVERERILIIEGKTKVIPDELADDPIFLVDKKADMEISKARAKVKTNREKNSERLKLQGVKWQRERRQHEDDEAQHLEELKQRFKEQRDMEHQDTEDDATKGMNSLRIHDDNDWRPCEQRLREFVEQERAKMKERSERIPTPFTSDPKDMQNILRARKRFQETELRIRKHIDEQRIQQEGVLAEQQQKLTPLTEVEEHASQFVSIPSEDTDAPEIMNDEVSPLDKNVASDEGSDISSGESFDEGSTISVAKQRYANQIKQELENDVAEGLLISKDQYDNLRYEDEKIMQLRNARDIRELYQLAEEIIIGERIESFGDGEQEGEEEVTAGA